MSILVFLNDEIYEECLKVKLKNCGRDFINQEDRKLAGTSLLAKN